MHFLPGIARAMNLLNSSVNMSNKNTRSVKHVFVCGLHRSGTTILAQQIGQLKNCTGFGSTGAGIFLDEGQYLQDVYPPDTTFGGVGRFGFSSKAHLTEHSSLVTSNNITRLRQCWEHHWDASKAIRVEKTPSNLVKTRFLQAVFPNAYFIIIRRHPVPVSIATQKWSQTPLHDLFEHWLRCHEIFDDDKTSLQHLYELSYEDYINNPTKHLAEIAQFIGTEPCSCSEAVRDVYNTTYLQQWDRMLHSSPLRTYYRYLATVYEEKVKRYGYSLLPSSQETGSSRHHLSSIAFTMARAVWPIYGVLWRAERRCKGTVKRIVTRHFPDQPGTFLD